MVELHCMVAGQNWMLQQISAHLLWQVKKLAVQLFGTKFESKFTFWDSDDVPGFFLVLIYDIGLGNTTFIVWKASRSESENTFSQNVQAFIDRFDPHNLLICVILAACSNVILCQKNCILLLLRYTWMSFDHKDLGPITSIHNQINIVLFEHKWGVFQYITIIRSYDAGFYHFN